MAWIKADFIEEGDVLMRDARVFRVVKIEHPHAVIREFVRGVFGPREIIELEGEYFRPSQSFLEASGIAGRTDLGSHSEVVIEFGSSPARRALGETSGAASPGDVSSELPRELFVEEMDELDFRAFELERELAELDQLEEFADREDAGA